MNCCFVVTHISSSCIRYESATICSYCYLVKNPLAFLLLKKEFPCHHFSLNHVNWSFRTCHWPKSAAKNLSSRCVESSRGNFKEIGENCDQPLSSQRNRLVCLRLFMMSNSHDLKDEYWIVTTSVPSAMSVAFECIFWKKMQKIVSFFPDIFNVQILISFCYFSYLIFSFYFPCPWFIPLFSDVQNMCPKWRW